MSTHDSSLLSGTKENKNSKNKNPKTNHTMAKVKHFYLDFPLDKGVGIWVAVDAEEEEPLALFVVAVVGVKNLCRHRQICKTRTMNVPFKEWVKQQNDCVVTTTRCLPSAVLDGSNSIANQNKKEKNSKHYRKR